MKRTREDDSTPLRDALARSGLSASAAFDFAARAESGSAAATGAGAGAGAGAGVSTSGAIWRTPGGEPTLSSSSALATSLHESALGLSSASATGVCGVASHARLETLLRQTELLRRLDADSHEAARAEAAAEVSALRARLLAVCGAADKVATGRAQDSAAVFDAVEASSKSSVEAATALAEVARLRASLATVESSRSAAVASLETVRRDAAAAAAASKQAIARAEGAVKASSAMAADLQAQLEAARATPVSAPAVASGGGSAASEGGLSASEASALRETVRAGARRERAAADAIAALRADRANATVLEERLAAAEKRAQRAEAAASALAPLRGRLAAAASALGLWDSQVWAPLLGDTAPGGAGVAARAEGLLRSAATGADALDDADFDALVERARARASAVAGTLASVQAGAAEAMAVAAAARARATAAADARAAAHARLDALEREAAAAVARAAGASDACAAAEVRATCAESLANGLRAACASYEAEDRALQAAVVADNASRAASLAAAGAAAGGAGNNAARAAAAKAADAAASAAREAADACRASSAARVALADAECSALRARVSALLDTASRAAPPSALAAETARVTTALADLATARAEIDVLWAAKGGSSSSSSAAAAAEAEAAAHPNARILHLAANPTSAAFRVWEEKQRALVDALRAEVEALRHASSAAAGGGGGGGSGSAGVVASADTTFAPEREDAEKRLVRIKDIFRERAALMRDAVCRLTGWKMDVHFTGAGGGGEADKPVDIHLRSTFAASATDFLHIRMQGASLELLETPAIKRVDPKNFAYLNISKSFPAFFSQCVIDEYERSTMGTVGGATVQ